jgi:hypothetical protein
MLFFSAVWDIASIMKARHTKAKTSYIKSTVIIGPSYGNFFCVRRKGETFDDKQ